MKYKKTLEFITYFIVGLSFIFISDVHPHPILDLLRNVLVCLGINQIIGFMFDEIEHKLEMKRMKQNHKQYWNSYKKEQDGNL